MPIARTIKIASDVSFRRVIHSTKLNLALFTHRLGRAENQDGLLYLSRPNVAAVSDGMGGSADGAKARALTIETLHQSLLAGETVPAAFWAANQQVRAAAEQEKYLGATLVAASIQGDEIEVVSCGDSRAYLADREQGLGLLTVDHSTISNNYQFYCGIPPLPWFGSEHLYNYLQEHSGTAGLTSFIGASHLNFSYGRFGFKPGDRLLLCSDGLHNFLPYGHFANIMLKFAGLKETVAELQEIAHSFMARPDDEPNYGDNFTALLLERPAQK